MAATRPRAQPGVGSAQWIQDENAQVSLFCGQEAEDFAFSARNEVEWLNEHMADIFTKDQVNVTEIFKTPGKLRGKTPRTAKKRNPLEVREPLSDIFSTNAQPMPLSAHRPSPVKQQISSKIASFKVAQDALPYAEDDKEQPASTDSGYHGMPEDDMEIDPPAVQSSAETHHSLDDTPQSPSKIDRPTNSSSADQSTTERSFHSAREELTKKDVTKEEAPPSSKAQLEPSTMDEILPIPAPVEDDAMEVDIPGKDGDEDLAADDSQLSSEASSPAKTLVRKSSLTFAALPPRDPIATKKSLGAGISRTSQADQMKASNLQGGFLGRLTGGKSLGGSKKSDLRNDEQDNEEGIKALSTAKEGSDTESKMTSLHNKSSTQRLQERINQLGKSQTSRPTKSVHAMVQPHYTELSKADQQEQGLDRMLVGAAQPGQDEEDDWIQSPPAQRTMQVRPQLGMSISADVMGNIRGKQKISENLFEVARPPNVKDDSTKPVPATAKLVEHAPVMSAFESSTPQDRRQKASPKAPGTAESFYPDIGQPQDASTTPVGSPASKRYVDGTLSASKSKLQSIMKTARGLFSSSAGISAQAKMETMSPSVAARNLRGDRVEVVDNTLLQQAKAHQSSSRVQKPISPRPAPMEARKTRSSTEKEERNKEREAAERRGIESEKEKVRQQETAVQATAYSKEGQKASTQTPPGSMQQSPGKAQNHERADTVEDEAARGINQAHLVPGRISQAQNQKLKEVRRPTKPPKEASAQPKAPMMKIQIGMPSGRRALNNTALASNLQESLQPAQGKQAGMVKKASNASLQSSTSNSNMKGSTVSKPKALIAAERKKEQDEREAQRKLDQKRDIERKRAAHQEENRRQEQRHRQEVERQREKERVAAAEDPKKIAQLEAIEKRRFELQKKDQRPITKAPNQPQTGFQKSQTTTTNRPELGGNRPPSRQQNMTEHHKPANAHHTVNPSKAPIKRVFDPENDSAAAPSKPIHPKGGQNYQQNESKRRRTEDGEPEEFPIRPTMAPPIRQSNVRKDGPKGSMFSNNYSTVPPPAASHHPHAQSLLKTTTSNQAYQQHTYQTQQQRPGYPADTARYRDGNKIPFAENPNPPHNQQQQQHQQQTYKTPLPSKHSQQQRQSPQYTHGENIHLAEIPTDSEDAESSPDTAQKRQRAASLPEWAQSPNLRELLEQQEDILDADAVFGPVASPRMEEMFKERHHRFRSRTSSANWAGQDRLTEEEIRRDVEARARMRRDGGWTFGL